MTFQKLEYLEGTRVPKTVTVWIVVGVLSLLGGFSMFDKVITEKNQAQKFKLNAGPCAATGYPMTIQQGAFITSDGRGFPLPSGHLLDRAWGVSSRTWGVGQEMQPVPERLNLLYFSYLEDRFYEGDFTLPTARIRSLLEQGFWDDEAEQKVNYNKFTVCVLPKGTVVVWLTGPGRQVLLSQFQARESNAVFEQHYPASDRATMLWEIRAEVPAAVRAEVEAGTLSAQKWNQYLVMYPWSIDASQTLALNSYHIRFLSGEYIAHPITADWTTHIQFLTTPITKAVPRSFLLRMTDSRGRSFSLKVESFEEVQTQKAFQTLERALPGSPMTLQVQIDPALKHATFVLKNAAHEIPLTHTEVRIVHID